MPRKYVDCRDNPSQMNCSLRISGEENEVIHAAVDHAVSVHGHTNNQALRDLIRADLKDDVEVTRQPMAA